MIGRNGSRLVWPAYTHKYKASDPLPERCLQPPQLATRQLAKHSSQQQAPHQGCVKVFVIYKGTLQLHLPFLTGHDILSSNLDITGDKDQLHAAISAACCWLNLQIHTPRLRPELPACVASAPGWTYGQATRYLRGLQRASKMLKPECLFKDGTHRDDKCLMIIACPTNTDQQYTRLLVNAFQSPQFTQLTKMHVALTLWGMGCNDCR